MNDVKEPGETQASESPQVEETQESAETETKEESTNDVDYQKELEMARKELEKKDKRIGQAEHVIEKMKSEGTTINQENIEEMVSRMVEDRVSKLTEQVRGDAIDSLIKSYASSDAEAELIKFHLENSIKPSDDDVTDILNAKALANKARFNQQRSEMNRAKTETEADSATSAGAKSENKQTQKFSLEEQKIMRAYGLKPSDIK